MGGSNTSNVNLLNDAADAVRGSGDIVSSVAYFLKKDKSEKERAVIDEKSNDLKAVSGIVEGTLKGAVLILTIAALAVKISKDL
ncbi:MAG: hypothetical protein FWD98_09085 [Defluviitaleaceae bacterium]|nr:hypothetical protein [Defluviitaleaceae bacterium]